jgi:L-fuculose-phosphate aldolase
VKTDWETRRDIIQYARKVYDKGLVAATDGNISSRMDVDRIMITPAGESLRNLGPDDLAYVDLEGNTLDYSKRSSSELPLHLEIYKQRPQINAIIHAHPPYATAFTIAGESMSAPVLPEVIVMLGEIPTAAYATPSSEEGAAAIRELIKNHDAILLDHHGMEKLEHAAKTLLAAKTLGQIKTLTAEEVRKLSLIRDVYKHGN